MPATALDAAARKQLRALAHHLEPVVRGGGAGGGAPAGAAGGGAVRDNYMINIIM
jgi:hypothetical protein